MRMRMPWVAAIVAVAICRGRIILMRVPPRLRIIMAVRRVALMLMRVFRVGPYLGLRWRILASGDDTSGKNYAYIKQPGYSQDNS